MVERDLIKTILTLSHKAKLLGDNNGHALDEAESVLDYINKRLK